MGDRRHTQINKVIGENEKCVFYFTKKLNRLFGQPNISLKMAFNFLLSYGIFILGKNFCAGANMDALVELLILLLHFSSCLWPYDILTLKLLGYAIMSYHPSFFKINNPHLVHQTKYSTNKSIWQTRAIHLCKIIFVKL